MQLRASIAGPLKYKHPGKGSWARPLLRARMCGPGQINRKEGSKWCELHARPNFDIKYPHNCSRSAARCVTQCELTFKLEWMFQRAGGTGNYNTFAGDCTLIPNQLAQIPMKRTHQTKPPPVNLTEAVSAFPEQSAHAAKSAPSASTSTIEATSIGFDTFATGAAADTDSMMEIEGSKDGGSWRNRQT